MTHSDKAALRGEPSYVWRSGQERRLEMIAQWAKLDQARVLDSGGGNGMYAAQIRDRYAAQVELCDIEFERVQEAHENRVIHGLVSTTEDTPYASEAFDTIISNEVIEHVTDDRATLKEMARILKVGGRAVIFCPNRWYPFETHGHYWRGEYHFGNTPLINYLPNMLRNKFAPHVRAYTKRGLLSLTEGLPLTVIHHARIYGGYDNLIPRLGKTMRIIRDFLYSVENTPLDSWGLSHFLVLEKLDDP
ncbi:MAG: class I SAM-dependent methyltransferase [Anaerolineae bacterium]|nr:class I SAM-dependent methyltransferase [Anaerolineae bacterium]MDQ7033885.1 class I SAM-dependent methyltransferase [Anaerolineae bacterium]